MKRFLEELAETVIRQYPRLEALTVVFPNRRAALFFRDYMATQITRPAWSPKLITIEELFIERASLTEADRFSLIYKLFQVYTGVLKNDESFDRFYFWGDMLLRDFDEVDKYLIPATTLFKDLSKLRELDESFDYLTDEQKKFLRDFWLNFEDKPAGSKEEFLKVWKALPQVYKEFTKVLKAEGLGYEGMIHREVADGIVKGKKIPLGGDVIFAGFNALTKAEELLMAAYVKEGATVIWDLDAHYVTDENQEAGRFFREYRKHSVLGKTFSDPLFSNFTNKERRVRLYGVPQKVGQAKLLGQILAKEVLPAIQPDSKGEVKTVVVLPDESLLMAVLHSLPESLGSVNVTMGYPLTHTPFNNLMELVLELQIMRKGDYFNHQPVTGILGHAYILAREGGTAHALRNDIIYKNRVFVSAAELQKEGTLLSVIFQPVEAANITGYLLDIVQWLGAGFEDRQSFDMEYAYHFHRNLSRLHEVLNDSNTHPDFRGFQKLFRQVTQTQKIPFTGEPLKGLQIMGVLETRNLDFENVFILSLNEGSLPAAARQGSYVPHGLRKAYGLPTFEHQDAMYAYLFYRVLQRSQNIRLFYNTEPDILGMGEMSRLLQQVMLESGWNFEHHILNNPIQLKAVDPIIVDKTPFVMKLLERYSDPAGKGISPSVLNDYIECSLRFYLKHLAGLQEAKEVEEALDARLFGNFVHNVLYWFYSEHVSQRSNDVMRADLEREVSWPTLERLTDRAFREHYSYPADKPVEYNGASVVVRAIVLRFAQRVLEVDKEYAPFRIEMMEEKKFNTSIAVSANGIARSVIVSGRIDRVDSKEGQWRVIDYKTGGDSNSFDSIESLFSRDEKRNKAAFQTILYTLLYAKNRPSLTVISPWLIARKSLFKGNLEPLEKGKTKLFNILPDLPEFEKRLQDLLGGLFDNSQPFVQTPLVKNCEYCAFRSLCRR